ncbi:tRNA nucleotidyltransferase [Bacillus phage G]|uniref:Gp522 n=1 Tax=Bacillus phage G TaxID=2884420 RepID=G3MAR3_9CAUD|nr:tRNA nucleotidyltransferase [Bacillus phage G]AEO93780.1 gp522 [Bacillus phage G]
MKSQAKKIIDILERKGYEAYLIGGAVRNTLHNFKYGEELPIKDFDIVTNASCEQVMELFEDTEARGVQFNVAVVKLDGYEFEVAQYRGESYPEGGSLRPDKVYPVQTLEEDLKRRDFTINAIAMDKMDLIRDPLEGCIDIRNRLIRAIGDPNERFSEDPLRMIRAFRFMSQLDYYLDKKTKFGIKNNLGLLKNIPHERMKAEIDKMLRGQAVGVALLNMKMVGVHKHTFLNSITSQQVPVLDGVLTLSYELLNDVIHKLEEYDRDQLDITELYYLLYYYTSYDEAEKSLKESMFLNEKEIERVLLLLKYNKILLSKDNLDIFNLVKEIGEQRGLSYLKDIIDSYHKLHRINLDYLLEKSLFKSQLPYNGNDIVMYGEKLNIKPGKWVGQVLDKMQLYAISEVEYEIETIIEEMVGDGK